MTPRRRRPGGEVQISGGGFLPGSEAGFYLFSEPVLLGTALIEVAVGFGHRDIALALMDSLEGRVDGCGELADRDDWITNCDFQVEFRELLGILRRNVSTMELPGTSPWWE